MESYKKEFIEFMVESEVLKFGDFTLKAAGSPCFMNAGAYKRRLAVAREACAIHDYIVGFRRSLRTALQGIQPTAVTMI
ncbi:MAG: hypothetical protein ACLVJ6_02995 [Merdibacter sp.]